MSDSTQHNNKRLLLIRHGQTLANIKNLWHGHTDTALSEEGVQQAQHVADFLHAKEKDISAIYASPLQRALNTAKSIAAHYQLDVQTDDDLMEFGIGDLEDLSFDVLIEEHNFIDQMFSNPHHRPPNGETRHEVTERVSKAIKRIHARHPNQNVIIVSHGLALSFALNHIIYAGEKDCHVMHPSNTGITEIQLAPVKLLAFNQTEHLD